MKSVILGTAGHVDHGKTALVEVLTGVNTDRWDEERRRGITIDLGFAPLPASAEDLEISVVDVPGHEDFVKNMLAGATGVDLLLLVVAADEGPMPQTREHLWIAHLLGVERGVVAVTKSDLVEPDWRDLVAESVREEIEKVFGPNGWPLTHVSALTGEGIEELQRTLLDAARRVRARRDDDLFRMPLDRSFSVRGVGTVVTGTVWSGAIDVGATVRVLPADRHVRVRGAQAHGRDVARAAAGQRAALALVGIERSQIGRGDVLTADPVWRTSLFLDARLRLVPDSPWPLKNWQRVRFHLGTAETLARVILYEGRRLEPGASAAVQLRLERPVVARAGDRFVLRFYSPVTTIGGGVVLDPWAPRRGRLGPDGAEDLGVALEADAEERVRRAVAGGSEGASETDLAVKVGVNRSDLHTILSSLAAAGALRAVGGRWFAKEAFERARDAVLTALALGHERDAGARGVSLESLRRSVGKPVGLVDAVLADLQRQDAIRIEGSTAALPDHVPRLRPHQDTVAEAARDRIRRARLAPPAVGELAAALGMGEEDLLPVLKFLARRGELVPVTPDLYFHDEAIGVAREKLRTLLAEGRAAAPSELRQALGVTRKYLIPLLEYLDATGFTRRTPEGRVLRDLT